MYIPHKIVTVIELESINIDFAKAIETVIKIDISIDNGYREWRFFETVAWIGIDIINFNPCE